MAQTDLEGNVGEGGYIYMIDAAKPGKVGGWGVGSCASRAPASNRQALRRIRLNIYPHPVLAVDVYG